MVTDMSLEEFEGVVNKTIEDLPKEFGEKLENVDVLVEIWPTLEDMQSIRSHPGSILFGLYRGIPQTQRGLYYSGVLPDKIVIFAGPILSMSSTIHEAKDQIKKTVLHEIGHHFGMSEEDIRKAEK
jgi:predicted Zn-dependent protease with MMP-like domain